MNASVEPPPNAVCAPFTIVHAVELVCPTTSASPFASTAIPLTTSVPVLPTYMLQLRVPFALILAANPSVPPPKPGQLCPRMIGPQRCEFGMSLEVVEPPMYALADPSSEIAFATSVPLPPKYVE